MVAVDVPVPVVPVAVVWVSVLAVVSVAVVSVSVLAVVAVAVVVSVVSVVSVVLVAVVMVSVLAVVAVAIPVAVPVVDATHASQVAGHNFWNTSSSHCSPVMPEHPRLSSDPLHRFSTSVTVLAVAVVGSVVSTQVPHSTGQSTCKEHP